jgi:glycosyltransferase involved in cell wall biosynthesis
MSLKLSIIIPVFNNEKYILETMDSLFNQSIGFENIEVILIDDKSTDNSRKIINDLAKKYSNVVPVFLDENSGSPSTPRNAGIEKVSTDYMMFLDSDDFYFPEMCEKMYDTIIKYNVDVVSCNVMNIFDSKEEPINSFLKNGDNFYLLNSVDDFPEIMTTGVTVCIWNKIFKTEVVLNNKLRFPEKDMYEDVYFSAKFYLLAKGIVILNDFFGYGYKLRREDDKSISNEYNKKNIIKEFNGLKNVFSILEGTGDKYTSLGAEVLLGWTKIFLLTDLDKACQIIMLNKIKPYYKNYKWNTKIVNYSLLFNIFANIGVKFFSLNNNIPILISKIIKSNDFLSQKVNRIVSKN